MSSDDPQPSAPAGLPQHESPRKQLPEPVRVTLQCALFVLLCLLFIRLPKTAADQTHDLGSRLAYEFYGKEKYRFGVDVIQNVGPLGYLQFPQDYGGILPARKIAFGIGFGVLLAAMVVRALRWLPSPAARTVWIVALLFLPRVPNDDIDPLIYLFLLISAHHLITRARWKPPTFLSAAVIVTLALLCLMKSTSGALIAVMLVCAVAMGLLEKRWRCALGDAVLFACAAGAFWLLASQRLSDIPAFVRGVAAFSSGYNEAMMQSYGRSETLAMIALGVIAIFVAMNFASMRTWRLRAPIVLFEAACFFIVWKHGVVRIDHIGHFWAFSLAAAPLLFLTHREDASSGSSCGRIMTGALWGATLAVMALSVAGAHMTDRDALDEAKQKGGARADTETWSYLSFASAGRIPFDRLGENFRGLTGLPQLLAALDRSLAANRALAALPHLDAVVGGAPIDQFGWVPGVPLLNGLNYHPRPMPVTFAAVNETLIRRNAEFYQSNATAPPFVIAAIQGLDTRLAPQDDSRALLELLARYRPRMSEKGFVLLQRNPKPQPDVKLTPPDSRAVAWGQSIAIPQQDGGKLWCKVSIESSLAGRVRSFFYKPAPVYIQLKSRGRIVANARFLAAEGPAGFLIRPGIFNNVDLLAAFAIDMHQSASLTPAPDEMRFVLEDRDDRRWFDEAIRVSFLRVE